MKKRLISIISAICLTAAVLFAFTACDNNNNNQGGHFFRLDFGAWLSNFPMEEFRAEESQYNGSVIVFTSSGRLQEFFDGVYSQTFSGTEFVKNDNFTNTLNRFDDDFFYTKSLAVFVVSAGNTANTFSLDSVINSNYTVTINLRYNSGGIGGDAMTDWLVLIEIPGIQDDTNVRVIIGNGLYGLCGLSPCVCRQTIIRCRQMTVIGFGEP